MAIDLIGSPEAQRKRLPEKFWVEVMSRVILFLRNLRMIKAARPYTKQLVNDSDVAARTHR